MDVTKVVLHDKRLELQVEVQRPWTRLTDEDIARLNNKREELIMILRQWHHYSRMQADRIISDWLFHHSQARLSRAEPVLPKRKPKPFTRSSASYLRRSAKTKHRPLAWS